MICRSGSSVFEVAGELDNGMERSDLLKGVARWMQISLLLGSVFVGALCFALGASLELPTAASAQAQSAGAEERVLLTVSEQRAHQALCVDGRPVEA